MIVRNFRKVLAQSRASILAKQTTKTAILLSPNYSTTASGTEHSEQNSSLLQFTNNETDKILDFINNKPPEDLIQYKITKARAQKIVSWRDTHGKFIQMEDLLQLGFGDKVLYKFCKSLLLDELEAKVKAVTGKKTSPFTIPSITESFRESCTSCVSIRVGVSSVTWSKIDLNPDGPCSLTHWEHHDITEKKLHLSDLIQRCLYLDYLIPQSDCYVFENPQVAQMSAPGSPAQINISVQKSQILATLAFALMKRRPKSETVQSEMHPNVFYLKRFLAAKLFNNLVGTEKVSTEDAVLELMRTYYNVEDMPDSLDENETKQLLSNAGNIVIPMQLRELYKDSEAYQREYLGQSMLLGLAFLRLCILKCPTSLSVISKNTQKSSV